MKYTQSQWDREIGWGKMPEKYKYKNKLEEYKDKINYDVWEDVAHVQGITFNRQPYNIKNMTDGHHRTPYEIKEINVNYSMKANEYVQSHNNSSAGTNDRDNKS